MHWSVLWMSGICCRASLRRTRKTCLHGKKTVQTILHLSDPAWWGTLPHRVVPYEDEWLPGLLLRCDESNHWESGTTLTYVYGRTSCSTGSHWIVPPPTLLDAFST